jgi:hypothetical protein
MVIVIMWLERPIRGLPAGIGPPGPWSPVLLLAGRDPAAAAKPQALTPQQPPKAA